jgi:ABC-2 type transport system ATP-binding protein
MSLTSATLSGLQAYYLQMTIDASEFAIETVGLGKKFGRHTALQDVSLAVAPGTVFGMIGPNGAGKTTTMRMLLDIVRPSSGSARVLGIDPRAGGPALRRQIGYLPGELRLEGRVTGHQLLRHFASISGPVPPRAISQLAERLDLDLGRPVRTLSKGNKQKLGIVQAFMHEPRLLVLDEPTSGLDPLVQQTVMAMVREASTRGQTVLLSSHVMSEIQQAADTVAILRAGRVLSVSDVDSLRLAAIRRVKAGLAEVSADAVRAAFGSVPQLTSFDVTDLNGLRLAATVEGDIAPFIAALAKFRITDLTVEEPDLEESVLALYNGTAGKKTDEKYDEVQGANNGN